MMYEKIGILAALSAKAIEAEKCVLGSGTIGERVAQLARKCEDFVKSSDEGPRGTTKADADYAEITRIATSIKLEAYIDKQGTLYIGRPYYFVNMGGSGERRDRAGR
jgi:hypothetical protein